MNSPVLILASASPRRADLLRQLGLRFRIEPSHIPETSAHHLAPHEICLANAAAKARKVSQRFPNHLVLGADTEVALGTRVFGKPRSLAQAAEFLRALAGRTHQVITGVCLICAAEHFRISFAESTHVILQPLTPAQIAAYLRRVRPIDKAGAYAVQKDPELIIEGVLGSYTNVVGLPLASLREALKQVPSNLRPLQAARRRK
jgi:septum formation protein